MASAPPEELPLSSEDLEGFWSPWRSSQPAPLLPHFPCPFPALPCYGLLHPPSLGLLAQTVSGPCDLSGGRPLLWPGPLLYSPLVRPGPPEDPASRAKASSTSRESTVALKAWLGQHLKNPYPSKGEKVLLALVSRMSLTQVSTWFANARRRLKKENRACWAPRTPKEGEEEEEEEEEEGESEGEAREEDIAAPGTSRQTRVKAQNGPGVVASDPWLKVKPSLATAGSAADPLAPKAKIWRVAEFATGPPPGRPAV